MTGKRKPYRAGKSQSNAIDTGTLIKLQEGPYGRKIESVISNRSVVHGAYLRLGKIKRIC